VNLIIDVKERWKIIKKTLQKFKKTLKTLNKKRYRRFSEQD
jgi:hypothetical protein